MKYTIPFLLVTLLYPALVEAKRLPKAVFNRVIQHLERTFAPWAERDGRVLEFYSDYDQDWAQAFARRWETDQVIVYGGLADIPGITEEVLVLTLCHELGHLYGGEPFSDSYNRISAEGQGDYWATEVCFKEIWPGEPERALRAAEVLTAHFARNRRLPPPSLSTPDQTVVQSMRFDHPSPQCRLDTFAAGIFGGPRPYCWYFAR